MNRLLKIGLSACFFHADPQRPVFKGKTLIYLEESLAHWVMSQGALAYMIPTVPKGGSPTLKELSAELDGLVLSAGSDVSPRSYGEEPLRPEWAGDFVRDQYEIALIHEFMRAGKPVLGICRGMQVLNVALGGTLYQDIETQVPGGKKHRDWSVYDDHFHGIEVLADSGLARLYGGGKAAIRTRVNAVHHQAVKDLGEGLVAEAKAQDDGIIEAIRWKGPEYVFGVQWHPEFHRQEHGEYLDGGPILSEFMTEAKKRRSPQA